jgi:O-succinylbenzoic acid--CoA ligase
VTTGAFALVGDELALPWEDFDARVAQARSVLARFPCGARVALRPSVDARTAVWIAAAWESQVTLVLQHPRVPESELARQRAVARVVAELFELPTTGTSTSASSTSTIASTSPAAEPPFAIVFTSGTSGTPKGAVLSRRAFRVAAEVSARNLGWRDDDRWLLSLPPAHVGGLSVILRSLLARRTVVLAPSLDASALPALVERHRVTILSLVPTLLHRLLALGWRPPAHVRAVLLGGAAATPSLLRRAREHGVPVLTTYGMTETCAQVATRSVGDDRDAPDVGGFLGGVEARVRDGLLELRGPQLFDGYLPSTPEPPANEQPANEQPANALPTSLRAKRVEGGGHGHVEHVHHDVALERPFDAEGWFCTGDLASIDDAGRLTILGRRGDLVVRGGENVYPTRVESVLESDPRIDAAVVLGLPDEEWGERVAVAVVARDPAAALGALRDAALAPFERPSRVAFFDALPTNATGKVDRSLVRARASWLPVDDAGARDDAGERDDAGARDEAGDASGDGDGAATNRANGHSRRHPTS